MNDICRTMNDFYRTMNDIAIYTLTSELHDEKAVGDVTKEFLGSLGIEYVFKGSDYGDYGSHALDVIYVRTGGTEGIFKRLLPQLQAKSDEPFYLLTSGKSNSLAASLEILSYLRLNRLQGEIVHGQADKVANKLRILAASGEAKRQLRGCKLGTMIKRIKMIRKNLINHINLNNLSKKGDVVRKNKKLQLVCELEVFYVFQKVDMPSHSTMSSRT